MALNFQRLFFARFLCLSAAAFLAFMPLSASYAKKSNKTLSEQSVKAFITRTTSITSGGASDLSSDKILKYLRKHIHQQARFKTIMKYEIPGYDTQESAMSLSKDDFIDHVKKSAGKIEDYDTEIEIISVKLSKDKTKATVQTRNHESAMMPVHTPEGGEDFVPIEGSSLCTQLITISKKGVLQMFNASCVTHIEFSGFN